MTASEIREAVRAGRTVHWSNDGYTVTKGKNDLDFLIRCESNGHCIGLTWQDGVTLNGDPEDFYIADEP